MSCQLSDVGPQFECFVLAFFPTIQPFQFHSVGFQFWIDSESPNPPKPLWRALYSRG